MGLALCWGGASNLRANDVARLFESSIRPVLAETCVDCHGPNKQKGGLRLDSAAALLAGGDSGPAIVPGDPKASLLLAALRYEDLEMPPKEPLSAQQVAAFEAWITGGAFWPETVANLRSDTNRISDTDRQWWAFQPFHGSVPEGASGFDSAENPIDRFVGRRLQDAGLTPAPRASRVALVRRVYFDVLGLPPTPEEMDAYLMDSQPGAWERLVDRLLADPRYGEHWARHWLDLVRYSDSDGWNQDAFRPHIWRYRDYVIRSLNGDKPYPEFVREQLAGDEMAGDDPENLTATGFLRLGIYEYNQRDARGHWNDIMNEMTDVAGDVFLGMSMACARCHDHKFDPVLQKDYFRLRSFFEPVVWRDDLKAATVADHAAHAEQFAIWQEATEDVRARIDALIQPYHDKKWVFTVDKFPLDIQACFHKPVAERTSWEHQMAYLVSRQFLEEGGGPLKDITKEDKAKHEVLKKELAAFDHLKPAPLPSIMAATDFSGSLSPTVIPSDPERRPVEPGFLSVLDGLTSGSVTREPEDALESSGRRTALAAWIGDAANPLTPRVVVNRVWQQHFGRGIVRTPNDFGHNGERPTHPELLDWLTQRFVDGGWRFKDLHRLILTSATWRQSADHPEATAQAAQDPGERLLWRFPIRRLKAEEIRDAMLVASGELQSRVGGPSVAEGEPVRGLYVKQFRNRSDTLLHAFDLSGGLKSVSVRNTTTTPTQSLTLINGAYALARAERFAAELNERHGDDLRAWVRAAVRQAWGREPTTDERERALSFLNEGEAAALAERQSDFCHVLLNSNEFLYLD